MPGVDRRKYDIMRIVSVTGDDVVTLGNVLVLQEPQVVLPQIFSTYQHALQWVVKNHPEDWVFQHIPAELVQKQK